MASGFWEGLKKPIMALAPMAEVTDAAFRRIIAEYGKPDIIWTEFVSADGLCSVGRKKLLQDLIYSEEERPIVAQLFGARPEHFYESAKLLVELGFDGIDINMGCPDRKVDKQGAGAALIRTPELAQEIVAETKRGAGKLPVSIKTRIGYDEEALEEWLPHLVATEPAAITIHGRTKKEMSKVDARWGDIARAVAIIDRISAGKKRPLVLGNGDVKSLAEAEMRIRETGVDGVMIGRGIFGNPWLFSGQTEVSVNEKLRVAIEHTRLFEELFGRTKNFDIMKKHYKAYVNGFPGAKELRTAMMAAKNADQVDDLVKNFLYSESAAV